MDDNSEVFLLLNKSYIVTKKLKLMTMLIRYFYNITGKIILFFVLIIFAFTSCSQQVEMTDKDYISMQEGFIVPNDTNKLWCFYHFIDDDISREGVTKDIEAIKKIGIRTVLIGNISMFDAHGKNENGPVPLFTNTWWDITVHAVNDGKRLGTDFGFFNCPGWSGSGGPLVSAEQTMMPLVYSEVHVESHGSLNNYLEKPADPFQDVSVLAFITIEAEKVCLNKNNSTITSIPKNKDNHLKYIYV